MNTYIDPLHDTVSTKTNNEKEISSHIQTAYMHALIYLTSHTTLDVAKQSSAFYLPCVSSDMNVFLHYAF